MDWSSSLAHWGGRFPSADAAAGEWQEFALESLRLPSILLLVGLLISGLTLLILCKVHIRQALSGAAQAEVRSLEVQSRCA